MQFYDAKVLQYVMLSDPCEEVSEGELANFVNLIVASQRVIPKVGQFSRIADALQMSLRVDRHMSV